MREGNCSTHLPPRSTPQIIPGGLTQPYYFFQLFHIQTQTMFEKCIFSDQVSPTLYCQLTFWLSSGMTVRIVMANMRRLKKSLRPLLMDVTTAVVDPHPTVTHSLTVHAHRHTGFE